MATLAAEAKASASEPPPKGAEKAAPEPMIDRLSDPGQWFEATPPPVLSLRPSIAPRPEQVRRRRVGERLVTLSMGVSVVILLAATVVRIHGSSLGAEDPRVVGSAPPSERVALAAEKPASMPAAAEDPRSPEPPSTQTPTTGELQLGATAGGHRVVVDGHLVRESSSSLQLPCGPHTVRIGYAGKARLAVVPCGGAVTVGP
jgi:hypothetical protein